MRHYYALIMAGGGGTRLWPLSRKSRPKQLLPLTEERTMFQVTVERIKSLIPPERIFVVVGCDLAPALYASAPQIPLNNFIIEPAGRDSGPAAGLGTYTILDRDPEAVIAVLSADHHIANQGRFLRAMRTGYDYAMQGHFVTLGIEPSFPSTAFGYIQRGDLLGNSGEFSVYRSQRFTEKPDAATAMRMVNSGLYSWNAGMFIWQASRAVQEFQRQQPQMHAVLQLVSSCKYELERNWSSMNKLSLDYAIMEKAEDVVVIPVDIGWTDVGTWATLFEVLNHDENGNARRSTFDDHVQIDTHDTLIVSEKMVVTIGLDNVVIVDTDDVVLVCHKDRAQDVRSVVQYLKECGQERIL